MRTKIGIILNYSPNWMGGVIYIVNIINTLDFLDDEQKPEIWLFYRPDVKKILPEINYSYLNCVEHSFPSIVSGNIRSLILRRNLFIDNIIRQYSLDTIFPLPDFPVRLRSEVKLVSWWADLQEKYYPEFFSTGQRAGRNIRIKMILRNCDNLVVSSQAVKDDFLRFYKVKPGIKISVFHFVSVVDQRSAADIEEVRAKYNLPVDYFIVSNQFHKHKNHRVVLLALARLKAKGIIKHVAFTGKFPAASDSPYLTELTAIIRDHQLDNQVTMLGVISRNEQLELMKHSQAVIQPSLFEGWSTVIEDAKSLQTPVIASGLKVNIEQLGDTGRYFKPLDYEELASIIEDYPVRNISESIYERYEDRIKKAAKELIEILK
jgi:glycosyltransferase involved in cell wall biosynthesis